MYEFSDKSAWSYTYVGHAKKKFACNLFASFAA